MRLDEIDQQIVAMLTRDARISNREVARLIGLSEAGVRKRLKRLSESGLARIAVVTDPGAVGLNAAVLVRIQVAPAVCRSVAESIARLEVVSFVALMTGRFNIVLLITARNRQEVAEIIHGQLRTKLGVNALEAIEIVSIAKHRLDLALVTRA